jgi:hypothetical protein
MALSADSRQLYANFPKNLKLVPTKRKNSDAYREHARTKDSYQESAVVEDAFNIYKSIPMKPTKIKNH